MHCPDCGVLVTADIAAASRGYRCMPCWRKLFGGGDRPTNDARLTSPADWAGWPDQQKS